MDTTTMTKQRRMPGTFWQLTFHSNTPDMRHVEGHTVDYREFDYQRLMQGQPFDGHFPPGVRLWIGDGAGPLADQLGNSFGWTIMSDRLVEFLWPMIHDCVQAFPAPLYKRDTECRVPGYRVLNVVKVVDCIDIARSTPWYGIEDELAGFTDACIDPARTKGAHMFKYVVPPDSVDFGVICSYELVKSLEGQGFTGLAFIRCQCKDEE
jgi:hypothetical protein